MPSPGIIRQAAACYLLDLRAMFSGYKEGPYTTILELGTKRPKGHPDNGFGGPNSRIVCMDPLAYQSHSQTTFRRNKEYTHTHMYILGCFFLNAFFHLHAEESR